jgi:hypothetical protein
MRRKVYAVVKQNGRWGVSARGASFLSCDSYQEALDVAVTAAKLLTRQETQQVAQREVENCFDDDSN